MSRIIVVGAGICGIGTALLLARDGHEVTVLERDASQPPESSRQAWDQWSRKGVAQFRQPHNFMPGLRRLLEGELPHVQNRLRQAGAAKFDLLHPLPFEDTSKRSIDDALWTYTARRPVGEWVFADAAANEPNVTVRRGVMVVGLTADRSVLDGVPHVTGIRTRSGEELRADLVVDATGRAAYGPKWLETIGARAPYREAADSGFTYYTRYFRGDEPQRTAPPLSDIGTISILTLPGDNGTWSVTIFASSGDKPMKHLRNVENWSNVLRACPLHAHWLEGEPITEVLVMGGVVDRYHRFVVDGSPVATGFSCVADAWACTNPSAGRGLTVGFIHALQLRDVLHDGTDDPQGVALRFDEATEQNVAPWYHAQVARDRWRFAQIEALRNEEAPPEPDPEYRPIYDLLRTMPTDPDLFRAGLEYIGTLTPVGEILQREGIGKRVSAAVDAMSEDAGRAVPGPGRKQLLTLIH